MRFITEFELGIPYKGPQEQYFKGNMQLKLGGMIADSFGWKERIFTDPQPNIEDMKRWSLEIEAFPMDKWVEFKKRFLAALPDYDSTSRIRLENALHDLESPDKPSNSVITNLSDQMEYRGSSTHCKACEDEAAGIKHIMAQKHTCKK